MKLAANESGARHIISTRRAPGAGCLTRLPENSQAAVQQRKQSNQLATKIGELSDQKDF